MSITSALQTGVSGLQANAESVGGISENIANANTVGYKRGFAHMVTTTASGGGSKGVLSVSAEEVLQIDKPGGLISTGNETDLAISGPGFFVVSPHVDELDQANYLLTRAGSFLPDQDGNLRNAAGFYLKGFPFDTEGVLESVDRSSFASMQTVNVGDINLSASGTTTMEAYGNLPSQEAGVATPGAPFSTSSEYFTELGGIERVNFEWQPHSTPNQWTVTILDANGSAPLGSVQIDFSDSGSTAGAPSAYSNDTDLSTAPAGFSFDTTSGIATITINNGTVPQTFNIEFGATGSFAGVTQFSGDFTQSFHRDGSNLGTLIRTEFDDEGNIYGVFDNGMRRALYEIPLGIVANPNGLIERQGNTYSLSGESGSFQALTPKGGGVGIINSGALEGANVDIAQEMTDLIRAQRAFSTNASVITTVDEMMDETTRLKR